MKDVFFSFLIALVVGSMLNGAGFPLGTQGAPATAAGGPQAVSAGQELVTDVDEGMFQGYVLDAKEPVLVEFYTDNCPHCVEMAPLMGKVALIGQNQVRVCKVNASKSPNLADRYGVSGVPAFVLFERGQMKDSVAGAMNGDDLRAWLARNNVELPSIESTSGT